MSAPDSPNQDAQRLLADQVPLVPRATMAPSEEERVWSTAVGRLANFPGVSEWHLDAYAKGLQWLASHSRAPSLSDINAWLAPTGWRAVYAAGYVPVKDYQALHRDRVFPISGSLRRMRDLDHSAAPDLLHDVVGHLPLLFDERYSALLQEWGYRGQSITPTAQDCAVTDALSRLIEAEEQDHVDGDEVVRRTRALDVAHAAASKNPSRHARMETFYTWAIEYGLVVERGRKKLMGAAVLSSFADLSRLLKGEVRFSEFGSGTLGRMVNYTIVQAEMFVSPSFDTYFEVLRSI